jgi:hypothetical protein
VLSGSYVDWTTPWELRNLGDRFVQAKAETLGGGAVSGILRLGNNEFAPNVTDASDLQEEKHNSQ